MSQHRSVWLARADQSSHPPLDGDLDVDVVVVGGGITGLTTALLLQDDGARVAVLEADSTGAGTTGYTTGKVTSQHTLTYHQLIEKHGERKARLYAEANQQAVETVASLAEETSADCQLERTASYVYTQTAEHRSSLESEHEAAVRLGLPASLTAEIDLPFPVELALRFATRRTSTPVATQPLSSAPWSGAAGRSSSTHGPPTSTSEPTMRSCAPARATSVPITWCSPPSFRSSISEGSSRKHDRAAPTGSRHG